MYYYFQKDNEKKVAKYCYSRVDNIKGEIIFTPLFSSTNIDFCCSNNADAIILNNANMNALEIELIHDSKNKGMKDLLYTCTNHDDAIQIAQKIVPETNDLPTPKDFDPEAEI